MNLSTLNVADLESLFAALPALIAALPGGKELKALAYQAEKRLEQTNPVELHAGPIHIHFDQLPVELRHAVLPMIFGPEDANAPASADAAATLLKLLTPTATS